ncbi:hypothetical protein G9A89_017096 [Geosiphon pyriformis]|nr:hypothetical protein G9A89_017096 [Geosiphon pyriformis]
MPEFQLHADTLKTNTYQVSWADNYRTELPPPPTWKEKGKGRAKEEPQSSSLGYVISDQRNLFYQPPRLICVDCEKKLSTMGTCIRNNEEWPTTTKYYCRPCLLKRFGQPKQQGKWNHMPCLVCGKILPDKGLWNDVPGRRETCNETSFNRLDSYPHNDHEIWRMANAKAESAMPEEIREIKDNSWMPKYTGPDYPKDDFFTDDPDAFQNRYQELAPTCEEQEQRLADLNTKLCDHCLISYHFQYCDECNLMFNLPPRILFPITKLPEPKEEYLAYPDLSKELELKWYSDNKEEICFKKAHNTNAGFDLQYSGQSPIIIAPHSLVKIDLKIALEIPVTKKGINIKGGIINAGYTENIIVMLQNNSNRPYKIESQEKIAQTIFLSLVKIPQLTPVTIREELGLTAQGINGFELSGRGNILINFTEEDSDQVNRKIQDQALLFKASPKICSLADVANLYLLAKVHKHFKIPIHNSTEDVIEIPEGTLIGFISADSQNSEKPQSIPDFAQLFLFCDITLQYADVFASENKFGHTDIIKHQIDTGDARPIKQ